MIATSMTGILWLAASAFTVGLSFTAGCWLAKKILK